MIVGERWFIDSIPRCRRRGANYPHMAGAQAPGDARPERSPGIAVDTFVLRYDKWGQVHFVGNVCLRKLNLTPFFSLFGHQQSDDPGLPGALRCARRRHVPRDAGSDRQQNRTAETAASPGRNFRPSVRRQLRQLAAGLIDRPLLRMPQRDANQPKANPCGCFPNPEGGGLKKFCG